MGLEEVKKEILEKANSEAKRIINEGKDEAYRITKESREQIREYRDEVRKETKKLVETMERRERAGAEFDAKKAMLDKKKNLIDKAFATVRRKLAAMPEKKREEYLRKLVSRAKKEIDVACIYANSNDSGIVKDIKGIEYKEADITGGIIAENSDGSIRVDYSYDEILDSIEKENMQEIAAKLFGK